MGVEVFDDFVRVVGLSQEGPNCISVEEAIEERGGER